jgi:hypothetical protein
MASPEKTCAGIGLHVIEGQQVLDVTPCPKLITNFQPEHGKAANNGPASFGAELQMIQQQCFINFRPQSHFDQAPLDVCNIFVMPIISPRERGQTDRLVVVHGRLASRATQTWFCSGPPLEPQEGDKPVASFRYIDEQH